MLTNQLHPLALLHAKHKRAQPIAVTGIVQRHFQRPLIQNDPELLRAHYGHRIGWNTNRLLPAGFDKLLQSLTAGRRDHHYVKGFNQCPSVIAPYGLISFFPLLQMFAHKIGGAQS